VSAATIAASVRRAAGGALPGGFVASLSQTAAAVVAAPFARPFNASGLGGGGVGGLSPVSAATHALCLQRHPLGRGAAYSCSRHAIDFSGAIDGQRKCLVIGDGVTLGRKDGSGYTPPLAKMLREAGTCDVYHVGQVAPSPSLDDCASSKDPGCGAENMHDICHGYQCISLCSPRLGAARRPLAFLTVNRFFYRGFLRARGRATTRLTGLGPGQSRTRSGATAGAARSRSWTRRCARTAAGMPSSSTSGFTT
jgi:hypothetical protein